MDSSCWGESLRIYRLYPLRLRGQLPVGVGFCHPCFGRFLSQACFRARLAAVQGIEVNNTTGKGDCIEEKLCQEPKLKVLDWRLMGKWRDIDAGR